MQAPWEQAAPKDSIPERRMVADFHDPALDAYEQQLLQANQSLEAARDRLAQARSLARVATAHVSAAFRGPAAFRERGSANRPLNGAVPTIVNGRRVCTPYTQSVYTIPFSLSYEVDLFGRVRNNVEAADASRSRVPPICRTCNWF